MKIIGIQRFTGTSEKGNAYDTLRVYTANTVSLNDTVLHGLAPCGFDKISYKNFIALVKPLGLMSLDDCIGKDVEIAYGKDLQGQAYIKKIELIKK